MIIVSLIGLKKCGKTTTAEALIRQFKARGYKVGGLKSMRHSKFTIDVEGKDTWRHGEAGADFVISLSKGELAYIERNNSVNKGKGESEEREGEEGGAEGTNSLEEALRVVPHDTDILICEGLTDDDPRILRVVLARSPELLEDTFEVRGLNRTGEGDVGRGMKIIALSGIMANEIGKGERITGYPDYPVFNCTTEEGTCGLADLILRHS